MTVTVLDHPFANAILTQLRDKNTPPQAFRVLTRRISIVLAVEAARTLPTTPQQVVTPLETTTGHRIDPGLVAVPILRAGLGMVDAVTVLLPQADIGYLGLERNEETAEARVYYSKLPDLVDKIVWLLDPMLATGGSASQAARILYDSGAAEITLLSIVSAPEGIEFLAKHHPKMNILTAALDRELNDKKYILPGLGDFGDRLSGTE